MKTITPITYVDYSNGPYVEAGYVEAGYVVETDRNYLSYGTNPYWEAGYAESGYVVETDVIRARFRYGNELVEFLRGPQYPAFSYDFIQPEEKSTGGWPITAAPVVIQAPFNFVFPWVADAELEKLRSFMFSILPYGTEFTFYDIGNGISFPVKFAALRLNPRHQVRGQNEVTLPMVRV